MPLAHFEIVGFADTLLIHYYLLLITYCRRQYWHARRDSLNQGVARSSPRKQCSPALHFIVRVQRHSAKKCGTPGGTRTPGLLLRRIGLGVFSALTHPFDAFELGNLRGIFPLVLLRPHRFFRFWVRIWVKRKRPVTKPVTRR